MIRTHINNLITFFLLLLLPGIIAAQDNDTNDDEPDYFDENYLRYEDHLYKDSIKTVLLYREGWDLSFPIIDLNANDKLRLRFDVLDNEIHDYYYTIIHCNAEWKPSDLMPSEYIDGFTENHIRDYEHSFNTLFDYVHYTVVFPNEDMKPVLSGNYIIMVYEDYDQENLVLTKRFCVVEPLVKIEPDIKQATLIDLRKNSQEVDFIINTRGLPVNDIFNDIKVKLRINNRWDNEISDLKPLFLKEDQLIYNYEVENVFAAGGEYRNFDIKSIRFQSEFIKDIIFERPYYHVYLTTCIPKPFRVYFFDHDLNGKYLVHIQEGDEDHIEADYVYVHFTLKYDAPLTDGNIYVFGQLSEWSFNNNNRMEYNFEKKAYTLTMLLKQGYYNYEYVFVKDGSTTADNTFIEGSHYETENDYFIYVYFRNNSLRYDKLVGVAVKNTLKNELEINSYFKK